MGEWYCFKCKTQVEPVSIEMEYLGMAFPIEGLRCPRCSEVYFTEETAKEKLVKTEKMIEEKAGE